MEIEKYENNYCSEGLKIKKEAKLKGATCVYVCL